MGMSIGHWLLEIAYIDLKLKYNSQTSHMQ